MAISPLIQAAKEGDSTFTQHLLIQGMNPNATDQHGETALSWAAHLGHTAVVKDLLAAGANVEVRGGIFGATPLSLAARGGHRGIVALLAVHADVNAQDAFGATPLMLAVEKYEPVLKPDRRILAILDTLLQNGAAVDAQDHNGDTALMWAVRWKNPAAVKLLLQAGSSISLRNHAGWTALEMADARGNQELLDLLAGTNLSQ